MTTAVVIVAFLSVVLGVPTWLGLRNARSMTTRLNRPDRCGVTVPGRLIDHGVVMDPDRLERAVE